MLFFVNDYCEGAHPAILQKLLETNMEKLSGYGTDKYCDSAKEKIRKACGCPDADVFFLYTRLLRPHDSLRVRSVPQEHLHNGSGHKVLTLPAENGKIKAESITDYVETFYGDESHDHMVFPGMVYISHPTEYGTLYTKKELEEISEVCHKYELPLFLDGARLGYGLVSPEADVTLEDIARCTDVFYIGGTKVGALCGEAVVFTKKAPKHFMTMVKQQGALLAKGRLLGIQFDTLFTGDLYTRISKNAIETAMKLKRALQEKGYQLFLDSPTNQQFVVLENKKKEELGKEVQFDFWEKYDEDHTVIRFATSWGTKMEDIDALIELL